MQADQLTWNGVSGWLAQGAIPDTANLVLYFGTRSALENGQRYGELRDMFPGAHVVGCSTGGQIAKSDIISDDDIAAVALSFDRTRLKVIADPALEYNTHFITIKGKTGNISIKLENVPAPENPKTAWLACYSALAALKHAKSPVRYGT